MRKLIILLAIPFMFSFSGETTIMCAYVDFHGYYNEIVETASGAFKHYRTDNNGQTSILTITEGIANMICANK